MCLLKLRYVCTYIIISTYIHIRVVLVFIVRKSHYKIQIVFGISYITASYVVSLIINDPCFPLFIAVITD